MENASKALLMAGGMLIALVVIGALLLMFNQLGSYQDTKTNAEKITQVADFNRDFTKYIDGKNIKGTDIITLAFKIVDYNLKEEKSLSNDSTANSVNYDIKMTLKLDMTGFNSKYAYSGSASVFANKYEIKDNTTSANTKNNLMAILNMYKDVDINLLKKMSSVYSTTNSKEVNKANIKEALMQIDKDTYKDWNGTNMDPTLEAIKNYKQYSEFKTSTFVIASEPEYASNGQIKGFSFKFQN